MKRKRCHYCSRWYPETYFGVAKTKATKVYYRRKCRYCYRETKQTRIRRTYQWVINYKTQRGCSKCGVTDPRVLDFHHRDENNKEFTVGYVRRSVGFERLKREIEKCEVLCANCHRILHYEEHGE